MGESPNLPIDPRQFERDKAWVESGFWAKVRRTLGRVPFLEQAVAAYYCAIDRETPVQVKAVLMGALAYFVMPADMIPDFIAWVGFADDATVLALAIRTVEPHIKEHHRRQARATLVGQAAGETGDPDARDDTGRTA
jgi:uncharacterized membrane protein YkvA (DUF1232 family)